MIPDTNSGADPEGGAPGARPPPPKIGKKKNFFRKIVIFHTKYPKNVRPLPPPLEKIRFFGVKS
jgi:hypothetical protein